MATNFSFAVLIFGVAVCGYWAQEKPVSKQVQPAGAKTAAKANDYEWRGEGIVVFSRTEGRFARHFDREGNPDEFLKLAQQDRLQNWHRLQELADLR
jgi:hypothetical protein